MSKKQLASDSGLPLDVWADTLEKKKAHFPSLLDSPLESVRIFHSESDPLRMDKVGSVMVLGWWRSLRPSEIELQAVRGFMTQFFPQVAWYLKWRAPKNVAGASIPLVDGAVVAPDTWIFHENGVQFEARKDQGDAFGLFLDQRDNRRAVRESAQGQRVLNLFAFTCGFSVYAALGGADEVVSVDLYGKYLDWGRRNFELNGLRSESFRFQKMDSLDYLRWAAKKGKTFHQIICDPPSFSRNGKKVFKVDQAYGELIHRCFDVLAPGGIVWFSTNYEKWTTSDWERRLKDLGDCAFEALPPAPDFEGPQGPPANQKTFRLWKPSK